MKLTAIIIGVNGQDGKLLYEDLCNKNYNIIGISKDKLILRGIDLDYDFIDINNYTIITNVIKRIKPNEVYYLASYNYSAETIDINKNILEQSININNIALIGVLNAIYLESPNTKLFYASSSHIFINNNESHFKDECSNLQADTIYGITKSTGLLICRNYRNYYNLYISVGILFNHESNYRPNNYLSKKIINAVAKIYYGENLKLILGNLDAEVDWGYAPDFINAFQIMLKLDKSDDFIIATGFSHTVREFLTIAFGYINENFERYVEIDKKILQRKSTKLIGKPCKFKNISNWEPSIDFKEMVELLVLNEIKNLSNNYEK
jgi:GDPmannose 4,6-dehydratase